MRYDNLIPSDLDLTQHTEDDVSIFIGENGSGKSTLLYQIAAKTLANKKKVIGIANSIHDKFDLKSKYFKVLRGRAGRKQTLNTLRKSLKNLSSRDLKRLEFVSRVLAYVGFDSGIGVKINFREGFIDKIAEEYEDENITQEVFLLSKDIIRFSNNDEDGITWINFENASFENIQRSIILDIFEYERLLIKAKAIDSIQIYLSKKGKSLSALEASSGELSLISSMIYIATEIDSNTVILIDEPENSLHPKWQKEYVKTLLDNFYLYSPKIIIATHSPLIVNGAELFNKKTNIYKSRNFEYERQSKEPLNIEEMYFSLFDVSTPKNRYLSERLNRLLNVLAQKKVSLDGFTEAINAIKLIAYDETQIEALEQVIDFGKEISLNNNNPNNALNN